MIKRIVGVIPARLGSTRLDQKVIQKIHGRAMIQWVCRRARQAKKLAEVVVACDDQKIKEVLSGESVQVFMSEREHPNGTSRIAEIADRLDAEVIINIQGDEPMVHPENIDLLAGAFEADDQTDVATLAVRMQDDERRLDPNIVKVVCDGKGEALYFSRAPIPHDRDAKSSGDWLKHIGMYGYRKDLLAQFVAWSQSELEKREKLEQLRLLENGLNIKVLETLHDSLGVDTPEDLEQVRQLLKLSMFAKELKD